jgi:tRNA1Val (adenine37-N6)-methyltransferase
MASNSYFQFKRFTIQMNNCAMKVGTDGVLLGAWFDVNGVGRLLDIGTGTGLLALMAAQRGVPEIKAVEIDKSAAIQACGNVSNSPWNESIEVINTDISDFLCEKPFDAIISNPPYFRDSLKSPDLMRTMAKHNESLSFEKLVMNVDRLLSADGEFSVIIPSDLSDIMEKICFVNGLYLKRKTSVITREGQSPKRYLISFVRSVCVCENDVLTMTDRDGKCTEKYMKLVKKFYLKY